MLHYLIDKTTENSQEREEKNENIYTSPLVALYDFYIWIFTLHMYKTSISNDIFFIYVSFWFFYYLKSLIKILFSYIYSNCFNSYIHYNNQPQVFRAVMNSTDFYFFFLSSNHIPLTPLLSFETVYLKMIYSDRFFSLGCIVTQDGDKESVFLCAVQVI